MSQNPSDTPAEGLAITCEHDHCHLLLPAVHARDVPRLPYLQNGTSNLCNKKENGHEENYDSRGPLR